jgi:hypothetical protein
VLAPLRARISPAEPVGKGDAAFNRDLKLPYFQCGVLKMPWPACAALPPYQITEIGR